MHGIFFDNTLRRVITQGKDLIDGNVLSGMKSLLGTVTKPRKQVH
jgi:hypothetical protein